LEYDARRKALRQIEIAVLARPQFFDCVGSTQARRQQAVSCRQQAACSREHMPHKRQLAGSTSNPANELFAYLIRKSEKIAAA